MGFFGGYIFDGQGWLEFEPAAGTVPEGGTPWLKVVIFDSDIADISYHPAGPGTGVAYLGYTPRVYFEDENASAPSDVEREAAGLAGRLRRATRRLAAAQAGRTASGVAQERQRIGTDLEAVMLRGLDGMRRYAAARDRRRSPSSSASPAARSPTCAGCSRGSGPATPWPTAPAPVAQARIVPMTGCRPLHCRSCGPV